MAEGGVFNWPDTINKPARDLSLLCFKQMGIQLDTMDDTDKLAKRLNVSFREIGNVPNRGQAVLQKWACMPDTTVYVLYKRLGEIGRHDIIKILEEELVGNFKLCMTITHPADDGHMITTTFDDNVHPEQTINEIVSARIGRPVDNIICCMEHIDGISEKKASQFRGLHVKVKIPHGQDSVSPNILAGFHPNMLSATQINELLMSYGTPDGSYLIRPSRESLETLTISVRIQGQLHNFRIFTIPERYNNIYDRRYYLFKNAPIFSNVFALVEYYKEHSLCQKHENCHHRLIYPV